MKFRMRPDVTQNIDIEEWKKSLHEYFNVYLPTIRSKCGRDLWQFFGNDFFSDGKIKKLEYVCEGIKLNDLTMEIEGYNIYRTDSDYSIVCKFLCHFKNVAFFSVEHETDPEEYFNEEHELTYEYSEINTLGEKIEEANSKHEKIRKYRMLGEEAKIKFLMENRGRSYEGGPREAAEDDVEEDEEDKVNFQSLIIYAHENATFISIVFEELYVSPLEEIAFELIKNDARYHMPLRKD